MSKVFIIDDDPIHHRIVQIIIVKHKIFENYQSFTDARIAVEFLTENAKTSAELPDIILLDLNMPHMDGWEFLEEFKIIKPQLQKEIKIYIVSSSVDEQDILRSKTYPFVSEFISKPLSPESLKNTLNF